LFFNGGMLTNSGTIKGGIGVVVDVQNDTTIVNSGSIIGTNGPGIAFVSTEIPDPTVVNSGLISGSAGIAVDFGATSPNNLILQTGGKFIGDIKFGNGTNTFDFSGYRGNILVNYTGADPTLVSGPGLFAQSGKQVAIMDDTAIRNAAQPIEDLVHGVRNGIADAQGATGDVMSTTLVSSYGPTAKSTPAAGAADTMASPFGMTGYTAWGSLIGGGSTNSGGSKTSTMYGGIIGGAQSEVQPGVVIGLLGGFGRTSLDVVTGPQTVTGNTGVLGVYGKAALDPVELEFSALAGLGANTSLRTVSTGTGDQTATGNFGSWFLAPELAAAIPVMVNDKGEIGVKGKVGYIAGGFSGYTETGSSSNATVGAETIGIFESSIELDGSTVLKSTDAGDVTLTGKVGLFAQVNVGGSNVPVSLLGVATAGSSASGASGYGVFGGVGINAPVSANMSVGAGFDGSVRSDGTVSGAAKVKLAGSF
ncbi:MAG: autotransporter outer membrane beta-barrel domain-containing protein, partial [Devosia sp.]